MDKLSFQAITVEMLPSVAKAIAGQLKNSKVVLFYGEMGSGKTTLIKEICKVLGVKEGMSSPTFSIVNKYTTEKGAIIYHFDLYRVKNLNECLDFGVEEYLDSGHYCFIEWPEILLPLLSANYNALSIEMQKDNRRNIRLP